MGFVCCCFCIPKQSQIHRRTNRYNIRLHQEGGLYYSGILAPENAPESLTASPLTLWNTIEAIEKRKDASLPKTLKFPYP
ncbi:MobA/MobL family protein (plasmid) [Escherichia coli]